MLVSIKKERKLLFHLLILLKLFVWSPYHVFAVPAYPYPIQITQPDGTTLTIQLKGDEFFHYTTTLDNYLITLNEEGFYTYAQLDNQDMILSTAVRVNEVDKRSVEEQRFLQTLSPNMDTSGVNQTRRASRFKRHKSEDKPMKFPLQGKPKSLVILVNYQDVSFITPNPQEAFYNLLNQEGYTENNAIGSARDYFRDSSMGAFDPEFVVVGPYTLSQNRAYYGQNDGWGDDIRPREMITEACRLAYQDGLDFSEFDTDHDGYVDNVFVYYAGHNEAEGGGANTIWPHRWVVNDRTSFNGKIIYDYACTSELRGRSGSNMCGIGTFVHEFGHVLGLPDYYPTNSSNHNTLGTWNVMDYGCYLNDGNTPCSYSAYDRFYLGWMTPVELTNASTVRLDTLTTSNTAYLVTQNGNHNMDGANPQPTEFLLFENRQQTGWDTYLPGHGMLVTRVVYNAYSWAMNTVNNASSAMGYQLVKARTNLISETSPSDPFPGTSNVTAYQPTLRSGVQLNKPLTDIREINGIIYFDFMGGGNYEGEPELLVEENLQLFTTVHETPSELQTIKISGLGISSSISIALSEATHYQISQTEAEVKEWLNSLEIITDNTTLEETNIWIQYNPTEPSYKDTHTDVLTISTEGIESIEIHLSGNSSRPVFITSPVATEASHLTNSSFTANWNSVEDATGYYVTLVSLKEGETTYTENFDNGLDVSEGWTIQATQTTSSLGSYGSNPPAISLYEDEYIETEEYVLPAAEFSFYLTSTSNANQYLLVEGLQEKEWKEIDRMQLFQLARKTITYTFDQEEEQYFKFRITCKDSNSYITIDDVSVSFSTGIDYLEKNYWTLENMYQVDDLSSEGIYLYRIKASDKTWYEDGTIKYENITTFSNPIYVDLQLVNINPVNREEESLINSWHNTTNAIRIYNTLGQQLNVYLPGTTIDVLKKLSKGQIYIICIDNLRFKIGL